VVRVHPGGFRNLKLLSINSVITLKGKTQKGKNRIREHGDRWIITLVDDNVLCLDNQPGWFIHPTSSAPGSFGRWIRQVDDKDFELLTV